MANSLFLCCCFRDSFSFGGKAGAWELRGCNCALTNCYNDGTDYMKLKCCISCTQTWFCYPKYEFDKMAKEKFKQYASLDPSCLVKTLDPLSPPTWVAVPTPTSTPLPPHSQRLNSSVHKNMALKYMLLLFIWSIDLSSAFSNFAFLLTRTISFACIILFAGWVYWLRPNTC